MVSNCSCNCNCAPVTLAEALRLRREPGCIPYAGGTDLMVEPGEGACFLFIGRIPELKNIVADNEHIRIGAACTFTEIIEHPLTPAILKDACLQIAAPAIRNAGTAGGNIANGSPKADSALIFMAADARLRLMNADSERIIPVREFYLGRKKLAMADDELIIEILIPIHGLDNYYYKKVGARNALSISRVSFAGIMDIRDGVIMNCAVSFGAVSDVILCFTEIDGLLTGKTVAEAKELKDAYISAYDRAIVPTRGRVGIEYRKDVCMNLLRDFLKSNGI